MSQCVVKIDTSETAMELDDAVSNPLSFGEYCSPLNTELVNWARRFTGGRKDRAEDVVQDALIKAFRTWARFVVPEGVDPRRAVRAWLFRIVGNVYLKHYKAERRRRELFESDRDRDDEFWSLVSEDPLRDQEDGESDEVREAIARLPPHQRTVIERHYFDGVSIDALAAELGVPKNTIFTRLHRARIAMRKHLRRYAERAYGIDVDVVPVR